MKLTNKVLFKKAEKVTSLEGLPELFIQMKEVMLKENGVGLAAPQVGISKRIFIMTRNNNEIIMCVNPQIKEVARGIHISNEGCLSHPGMFKPVIRYPAITLAYYDEYGNFALEHLTDSECLIAQHEMDHLNGITIAAHQ